ncbi:MAG: hypothetical protein A2132_01740 [Nitrospirae bacterium RBG_16_43_11]|nr:MAG: hypothetical protein A2132_01740 [Nitrospirae bacterium RBG_16_43_11]
MEEKRTASYQPLLISRRDLLKIIAVNLMILGYDARMVASKIPVPKGIYAVTNTANWIMEDGKRRNLFEIDFVDGVTNYTRWAEIEKEEGSYDWKSFERMIKEAADNNKKLSYNIISGNHAPDWVYNKAGVHGYEYFNSRKNKRVRTYLPWVESGKNRALNSGLLKIWDKTILSFAKHLHNHPLKDSIAYVAITGGPTSNGLEIIWAASDYNEFSKLNWDEEVEGLFIHFWMKVIDIFMEYMPDVPLGLAFTDLFGVNMFGISRRNIEISKTIVDYALKVSKIHNATVVPMGLWLGNIDPDDLRNHPLVRLIRSFNVSFALQGGLSTLHKKDMEKMLSLAEDIKSSWIELWHSDILNEDYSRIIKDTRRRIS